MILTLKIMRKKVSGAICGIFVMQSSEQFYLDYFK